MNDEYGKTEKPPVEDWEMSEPVVQAEPPVSADDFNITMVGANPPSKAAVTEDWAMNVPNTNPSADKGSGVWEMPEPVFRHSSGRKLDKVNRKNPPMPPSGSPPVEAPTPAAAAPPSATPNPDLQSQPFISEDFSSNPAIAKTYVKPKSGGSKILLLIIGLTVLAALVAACAVGVYYWFFYKPAV